MLYIILLVKFPNSNNIIILIFWGILDIYPCTYLPKSIKLMSGIFLLGLTSTPKHLFFYLLLFWLCFSYIFVCMCL